MQIWYLDIAV